MRHQTYLYIVILTFSIQACHQQSIELQTSKPPNILLIVADDLAYSDLGSFGSEISTLTLWLQKGLPLLSFIPCRLVRQQERLY
jgi:hypothetical protein